MKKIKYLLSALAIGCLMLTSCDYQQELPPVAYPDGGSEETMGNGRWDHPYAVWQVLNGIVSDSGSAWATGYIVGYVNASATKLNETSAIFSAQGAAATNILLANTSDEDNWENCIAVQLPSGPVRNAVNLSNNPDNLGRQVSLHGTTGSNYFGVYGLRSCDAYNWGPEGIKGDDDENEGALTFLTGGLEPFTIDNVTLPSPLSYIWSWDNTYGATASAFYSNTNYAAEAYLVSPEITLSATQTKATFSQALNYLRGNDRADFVNVEVREGASGAWTVASVSDWPEGTGWGFVDGCTIDLSAYAGKTIQIGFHYKTTSSCAPTWELKRLVIPAGK